MLKLIWSFSVSGARPYDFASPCQGLCQAERREEEEQHDGQHRAQRQRGGNILRIVAKVGEQRDDERRGQRILQHQRQQQTCTPGAFRYVHVDSSFLLDFRLHCTLPGAECHSNRAVIAQIERPGSIWEECQSVPAKWRESIQMKTNLQNGHNFVKKSPQLASMMRPSNKTSTVCLIPFLFLLFFTPYIFLKKTPARLPCRRFHDYRPGGANQRAVRTERTLRKKVPITSPAKRVVIGEEEQGSG